MTPEFAIKDLHTIKSLCERSDAISREKGWVLMDGKPRPFSAAIALMHSELSEALEDYRNHKELTEVWYWWNGFNFSKQERDNSRDPPPVAFKPCGIPTELADFVIRVCQHCGTEGKADVFSAAYRNCLLPTEKMSFEDTLAWTHWGVSMAFMHGDEGGRLQKLAEAVFRIFRFCADNDIDLWAAIDEKEAFNRTRPHRHGGKRL